MILNEVLSEIKLNSEPLPVATVKLFNIKCNQGIGFSRLLIIRELYNNLYKVTSVLNKCFGLSILVSVGNDFLSITSNFYWIFLTFQVSSNSTQDFLRIAGSAVWCIPHLFTVVLLSYLCHLTTQNASLISLNLHKIDIDVGNIHHNAIIAGATTTYLIILIQFHMSEQSGSANTVTSIATSVATSMATSPPTTTIPTITLQIFDNSTF
uniref:Uncharacterized protein n=1 Tax=Megaselia scalaris TaxID=36166 RepID=T1GVD0_MEGSC